MDICAFLPVHNNPDPHCRTKPTQIVAKLTCPCQQCYESHWDPPSLPPSNAAKFTGPKKRFFLQVRPRTIQNGSKNSGKRTRAAGVLHLQHIQSTAPTDNGEKVRAILHCYFYDDTHGSKIHNLKLPSSKLMRILSFHVQLFHIR